MGAIYGASKSPCIAATLSDPSARDPSTRGEKAGCDRVVGTSPQNPTKHHNRREVNGGMVGPCQSPFRASLHVESPFVLRPELLTLVPHSMSTIDRLEAEGKFPERIRLEPTNRVAWLRREVTGYLRHLAKRRQSAAKEDHEAVNQELVARSKQSGPTPEDQPANPDHQFAPASATSGRNPDVRRR